MQHPARRATLAAFALLALAASPVRAQDAVRAKAPALWLGAGVGPGWFRFSCPDICAGDRDLGLSGALAGGARLANGRWLVGLQLTGYTDTKDDDFGRVRTRALFVGPTARWYPTPASRLWLKFSAGVLSWRARDPDDEDAEPLGASPFAAEVGAGYDLPVSRRVSLAPFFNFTGSMGGSVRVDGALVTDDPGFSLVQLGVGLTWR